MARKTKSKQKSRKRPVNARKPAPVAKTRKKAKKHTKASPLQKSQTVYGQIHLIMDIPSPGLDYYVSLPARQQQDIKEDLWRQIADTVDLAQLKPLFERVEIEVDENGHKPEVEIGEQLRDTVEMLTVAHGGTLTVATSDLSVLGYYKYDCIKYCCRHGYKLLLREHSQAPLRRWIVPSAVNPSVIAQMKVALVWDSDFPEHLRGRAEGWESVTP